MYPNDNTQMVATHTEMTASATGTALFGIGGLIAAQKAGLGSSLLRGSKISLLGMDPAYGAANMGSVFAFGDDAGQILKTSLRGPSEFGLNTAAESRFMTGAADRTLKASGLMAMSKMNMILPLALTSIGAINASMDEGVSGFANYMVQDFFAMNAANLQNNLVMEFDTSSNLNKIAQRAGVSLENLRAELAAGKGKGAFNIQRGLTGFGRNPMLGNLRTMMGGLMGADMGMSAGRSLGKALATSITDEGYGQEAAGFVGSIFGAAAGAKLGAFAFASFSRAAVIGGGLYAGSLIAQGTYSMLESGYSKRKRSRGFNYASDTSQFMTQQAVTMRQRAMQAMHKSHLNARSAFGQEATITHMNRDMFSHYKRL